MEITRRNVLRSTAVVGAAALAGCSLGPSSDSEDPDPIARIGGGGYSKRVCHPKPTASADIVRQEEDPSWMTGEEGTTLRVEGVFPRWETGLYATGDRTETDDDRRQADRSETTMLVVVVHPISTEDSVRECRGDEGIAHTNFVIWVRLAATDQFVLVLLDDLYNEFANDLVPLATWPVQ